MKNKGKSQLVEQAPVVKITTKQIYQALEVIKSVMNAYGYHGRGNLDPTAKLWLEFASEIDYDWMKVAKYKLAAFYSFHNHQPMPIKPYKAEDRPDFLIGGGIGRFIKSYMANNPGQKESLLQSLKQSKKGMPRPQIAYLRKAEDKFFVKMTSPRKLPTGSVNLIKDWNELEKVNDNVETVVSKWNVQEQLRRTVKELFSKKRITFNDRVRMFFPSTSANYINSRSNMGTVGSILSENRDLIQDLRRPGGHTMIIKRERDLEDEEMQESQSVRTPRVSHVLTQVNFERFWIRLVKRAKEQEQPVAIPVALAEALKTRIITKGPPLTQAALRNIWKFIHTILRKHPTFTLIGKPVTEQYVLDRMGHHLKDDETYLSGDYEAATDNLEPWVSNTIAESISEEIGLGQTERELFIRSLTGHIIEKDGKRLPQTGGQLMGSITSFPVLCIANAAMCRWAIEVAENRVYTLQDSKLMINGDDCGLRSKQSVYEHWRKITTFVGLNESLGKTYRSREFIDINSTSFRRVEPRKISYKRADGTTVNRDCPFEQVKYVNAGLLLGMKRSQGGIGLNDQSDPRNTVGVRAHELIRLCPEHLHTKVMRSFINTHRELLDTARLPWYIPEWLGGLGLPIGPWGEPSELDLRLAHRVLLEWRNKRPVSIAHQDANWKIWQLAAKNLPSPVYSKEKNLYTEQYNEALGKQAVNLLFDSNYELKHLFDKENDKNLVRRAISHNAKLYKPRGRLPQPLSLAEIKYQSLYPNWVLNQSRSLTKLGHTTPGKVFYGAEID